MMSTMAVVGRPPHDRRRQHTTAPSSLKIQLPTHATL
jgi:hypothetical protein